MRFRGENFELKFNHSATTVSVSVNKLSFALMDFLGHYGGEFILGRGFNSLIGDGDGTIKFLTLMEETGYENNPTGFFYEILSQVEALKEDISVNGKKLPHMLVLRILEEIFPKKGFVSIKSVQQLQKATNTLIPQEEHRDIETVIQTYPVRLSWHIIRQMMISPAVRYQYMPFVDELDGEGLVNTWVGQFHRGLLEQMYQNRPIFVLNMTCPVYCRFCFRKHKDCRDQKSPTIRDVKEAVGYIEGNSQIKEIVLTGGDPFTNKETLTCAVEGLLTIPHVQTLRIATRSIAYFPHLFLGRKSLWIDFLLNLNKRLVNAGKNLEIATHFIHPDELSVDSLRIISQLTASGIRMYIQTPLLNNCNDSGPELVELYTKLRAVGAEMHYIYIPCSPIQGNRRYLTPISKGLEVARYLRKNLSDRAMPKICTATSVGKIDWGTSGWAIQQDEDDERYIWLRTPYAEEYFLAFAPDVDIRKVARVNSERTLEVKLLAEIGDENIFKGTEPKDDTEDEKECLVCKGIPPSNTEEEEEQLLAEFQSKALNEQTIDCYFEDTGIPTLFRTHKTRAEVEIDKRGHENEIVSYLKDRPEITEVVIFARKDALNYWEDVANFISRPQEVSSISVIRLRFVGLNYTPEKLTDEIIDRLGKLNKPSVKDPKRIEIETQFLHSSEFKPEHAELVKKLRMKGIITYCNTPLIGGVNDSANEILKISYQCRQMGVEFHNLYVNGLSIQGDKISDKTIIDIATNLRRYGSGREIPRYVEVIEGEEIDFGYKEN